MILRASTRWAVLVAIAALLLIPSSTAVAVPIVSPTGPPIALFPHAKPVSKMSLREKEKFQLRALQHYRSVVRSYLASRRRNAHPMSLVSRTMEGAGVLPRCKALNVVAPANVCWYANATRWTARELAKTQLAIKRLTWSGDVCSASRAACAWYADGATQCEVSHEGAFTTNTGNGYYGRFQADVDFQQSTAFGRAAYARYGTADKWPPSVQIEHAYQVWTVRGWAPWPPYAKYGCAAYHGRAYTTE